MAYLWFYLNITVQHLWGHYASICHRNWVTCKKLKLYFSNLKQIFFLLSYYLLSSLPSPFFLGLEHHNSVNLSVWQELVFIKSCLQGIFLQVLMLYRFGSEKDSHNLFPVDDVLIQLHFLKNQSPKLCKFILSRTENSWCLLGLNPGPHWKQITKQTLYL